MWADFLCAPHCLDMCFTIPAFADAKERVMGGKFPARDWAWPPTQARLKNRGDPWTARSIPRQQLSCWSRAKARGPPSSFLHICASHLEASLHPSIRGHRMEPLWSTAEKRFQICFARSLTQVAKASAFSYFPGRKQTASLVLLPLASLLPSN